MHPVRWLFLFLLLSVAPAQAQAPTAPATAPSAGPSAGPQGGELGRLIEVLRDDARRAEFLRALEAAQRSP
uniref:hypothetical protein n=1 Tax=Falsiroseomonas oryziterrae TaxID=2911368 RepID=UPI001F178324